MCEQSNKKKINRGNAIRCVCFLLVLVLTFSVVQTVLSGKWYLENSMQAGTKWYDELEELRDDTVDVFFCGTSHSYAAIDPMYMYENTGLAGYVLAAGGLHMDLEYLYLKAAFETQHPKYVLLDMSSMRYKSQHTESMIHRTLDQLPLTKEKVQYILDNAEIGLDILNGTLPFFRYHSRWEELTELDFKAVFDDVDHSATRGHGFGFKVVEAEMDYYKDKNFKVSDENRQRIEALVELCRENGAIPVFYKCTSPDWNVNISRVIGELAEELGVDYFDMATPEMFEEMGIDLTTDFRDSNNHVNQNGAEKTSIWLANYLQETYGLEDHRGEYTDWDADIKSYNKYKSAQKKAKDLSE